MPNFFKSLIRKEISVVHRKKVRKSGEVITHQDQDPFLIIQNFNHPDIKKIQSLIIDELRRLHEGSLARYGLKLSEFKTWQAAQKNN